MTTPKLGLNELVANQSSPHVPINSALRKLDALVQLSVEDRALNTPPGSPADGDVFILGAAPVDEWSAFDEDDVVVYVGTAYVRLAPGDGWLAWVQNEAAFYVYRAGGSPPSWQILETGGGGGDILTDSAWSAPGELVIGDGSGGAIILPPAGSEQWLHSDGAGAVFWDDLPASTAPRQINGFSKGHPANNEVMFVYQATTSLDFYVADMQSQSIVDATADATITVKVNGTSKGHIHVDAAGGYGFGVDDVGGPHTVTAGSIISFHNQASTDATMADVAFSGFETL